MKIGIDISQIAHENTGVGNYVKNLVEYLLLSDKENQYVLFYSSLRKKFKVSHFSSTVRELLAEKGKVVLKSYKFPPTVLDILWNKLHIFPIEVFLGDIDVFISSDWVEPPTKKAKKATILYDLIVYKYSEETSSTIVSVQKRKLAWVKKESKMIFCISESTKRDAMEILGIDERRLQVIYPGLPL